MEPDSAIVTPSVINPPLLTLRQNPYYVEVAEDVVFGSIAGIAGKFIEHPIDTIKVRLQSQLDNVPLRYNGPLDCFRQAVKSNGFFSLYRGMSVPLFSAAAESSSVFLFEKFGRISLYKLGLASPDKELSLPSLWLTGAISGFFTSFVLTPAELIKCKIQAPMIAAGVPLPHLRPILVIQNVFCHEGLRGFWRGQTGTMIRETGGGSAWFGAKETVSKAFLKLKLRSISSETEKSAILSKPLPLWQQAIAGASGGVSYIFLCFPADTVKSRMQTSPLGNPQKKRAFWDEGLAVWKQSGVRGLYRGCGITSIRAAFSSAFIFMIHDGLKQYFHVKLY